MIVELFAGLEMLFCDPQSSFAAKLGNEGSAPPPSTRPHPPPLSSCQRLIFGPPCPCQIGYEDRCDRSLMYLICDGPLAIEPANPF